jgi:transposase
MSNETFRLNGDQPAAGTSEPTTDAPVRYETVNRQQVELQPCDLEALLPPGHAARLVWRFVEGLDLQRFYAAIRARDGGPGRAAIDPKILVALWLYATIDGVGSARALDRLCYSQDAYRWIRGGVSVNYHSLSDFRVQHRDALDDLLTQSIAALLKRAVVTLARVAQDGTRVRASAGMRSFRRRPTLEEALRLARQQVERTARQEDGATLSREAAAQARAAAEHLARVEEALAEMPDGGFRPAYNVHFATDVESRVIVGVQVTNVGSDQGQLPPMLNEIERRTRHVPDATLVDGGFVTKSTVDDATRRGTILYAPVAKPKGERAVSAPRPDDSAPVALWRARMATDAAKALYKQRAATAEWVNADARTHRTLTALSVRGLAKVHLWALWAALAHNMIRTMEIVPHLMT